LAKLSIKEGEGRELLLVPAGRCSVCVLSAAPDGRVSLSAAPDGRVPHSAVELDGGVSAKSAQGLELDVPPLEGLEGLESLEGLEGLELDV
jgi:hypothetical protein